MRLGRFVSRRPLLPVLALTGLFSCASHIDGDEGVERTTEALTTSDGVSVGDFNGDGKADAIRWNGPTRTWTVSLSTPSGNNFITQSWSGMWGSDGPINVGDLNGDGMTDVFMWRDSQKDWTVNLSTGYGFNAQTWQGDWGSDGPINVGDLNGDGMSDVFMWRGDTWTVNISTGTGFTPAMWSGAPGAGAGTMKLGDFDGDHRTDVIVWNGSDNTWRLNLSNGSGWSPRTWTGAWGSDGPINVGDLNGDGKSDVFMWRDRAKDWTVNLSTGGGFSAQAWQGDWGSDGPINVGDLNGDGKSDVFMWRGDTWTVNLSTGSNFAAAMWPGVPGNGAIHVGDLNGDGMSDVFMLQTPGQAWGVNVSYGTGFWREAWSDGPEPPFPAGGDFVRIQTGGDVLWNYFVDPGPATNSFLVPNVDMGDAAKKCEDGLQVAYQRGAYEQSTASEVHVFALEPWVLATQLGPARFKSLAAAPNPGILPNAAVLAFPAGDSSAPQTMPLAASMFWGAGGAVSFAGGGLTANACYPAATSRAWVSGTDIAAVAVYQHGLCAQTEPLSALLAPVASNLYASFAGSVNNPTKDYLEVESFVARPGFLEPSSAQFSTNDPTDVRGGFDLNFDFHGDHASAGNEVGADYHYYFGLRNGVLDVDTFVSHALFDSGVYGWAFADRIRTGLEQTLPQTFYATAQAKQAQEIPGVNNGCQVADDCTLPASLLSGAITVDALQKNGFPAATPTDVLHMQCAMGNTSACQLVGLPDQFANRWTCAPGASTAPTCHYVVPIARINVFEDEIEAVFYDGPEIDNGAYGLQVASAAQGRGDATRALMCTAKAHAAPFTRSFALVSQ
jgi:hypothetical protein